MSEADWKMILSHPNACSTLKFQPNQEIIPQGSTLGLVCQISSGSCQIFRVDLTTSVKTFITSLRQGEMFGEVQFLTNTGATASVFAGPAGADILALNGKALSIELAKKYPELIIRLYHHLCAVIAGRVVIREETLF